MGILLNKLIPESLIYEGLIFSVSIDSFVDYIKRWAISSDKFRVIEKNGKIQLNFIENLDSGKELDNLIKVINTMGWFISAYLVNSEGNLKWKPFNKEKFKNEQYDLLSFQVEAKYDVELNVRSIEKLYHISPSIYEKKIQKIGLSPKSLSKISSHPNRIYFTKEEDGVYALIGQFSKLDPNKTGFIVYEIDVKKWIRINRDARLFNDPNFPNGIYTLSNVHPSCLHKIDTVSNDG
jgi:hypothetical protein